MFEQTHCYSNISIYPNYKTEQKNVLNVDSPFAY
jgi:hypothetical protein